MINFLAMRPLSKLMYRSFFGDYLFNYMNYPYAYNARMRGGGNEGNIIGNTSAPVDFVIRSLQ